MRSILTFTAAVCMTTALGACAGGGVPGLTTASVAPTPKPVAAVDPACGQLREQIATLKADGTVARVEKVAVGDTRSALVKRSALAKVAELNRLNDSYRSRCSNPVLLAASASPASTTAAGIATSAAGQVATAAAVNAAVSSPGTAVSTATSVAKQAATTAAAQAAQSAASRATNAAVAATLGSGN